MSFNWYIAEIIAFIFGIIKRGIAEIIAFVFGITKRGIAEMITFIFAGGGFLTITSFAAYHQFPPPDAHDWPLWFAPALTFAIGILTCGEQLYYTWKKKLKEGKIIILNIVAIVWIFLSCFALNVWHEHWAHILIVSVLFGFFVAWDLLMMHWLNTDINGSDLRKRIRLANLLINVPTLIGFLIILGIIVYHPHYKNGHPFINIVQNIFDEKFTSELRKQASNKLISSEAEFFVSGAIAFHLVIVAGTYFFTSQFLRINQEDERKK